MAKVKRYDTNPASSHYLYCFSCPGCKCDHSFDERWSFNGDLDRPTFHPSLLVNASIPAHRCHSFVVDGRIQFLSDCHHELAGQTIELPDLPEREE